MKLTALAIALLGLSSNAQAVDTHGLHEGCKLGSAETWEEMAKYGLCLGYMQGFQEGYELAESLSSSKTLCFRKNVTLKQLAAIYAKWMDGNPQAWDLPPYATMSIAMKQAFPCK
jgi:hypothetical protein